MDVTLDRIAMDPLVMGGRPCAKGTRVTVGTIVGLLAEGHDTTRRGCWNGIPIFTPPTCGSASPMRRGEVRSR